MTKISVVIPCYNEQARIGMTLLSVLTYLDKHIPSYEVICVNDGSIDKTDNIIQSFAAVNEKVRIYNHDRNYGKGAAVKTGLMLAKNDTILVMDADHSVPITTLDRIVPQIIEPYWVIKGQREAGEFPLMRRVTHRVYHAIVRLMFGFEYDTQCPFTLLRLPPKLYLDLRCEGFSYDVELLLIAQQHAITIKPLNVEYRQVKGSKVTFPKAAKMLGELIDIKARSLEEPTPLM